MRGCSTGRLGSLLSPQLAWLKPRVGRERKRKEKKGSHRGAGGPRRGGRRWLGDCHLRPLIQPPELAGGEKQKAALTGVPGKQRQVTQGPFAAPEVGLGIEFRDW